MQEGSLEPVGKMQEGSRLEGQVDQNGTSAVPEARPLAENQTLHLFCPFQACVVSASIRMGFGYIYHKKRYFRN